MSVPTTEAPQQEAKPTAPVAAETVATPSEQKLPDDHPLVKTLAEQKKLIEQLRAETELPGSTGKVLAELREKAKKFDEIEESNRTELEKVQARAEAAERILAEREEKEAIAALVAEVAAEKGVPANALRGASREDLEEHADELLALIPVTPVAPSADGQGNVGEPIGGVKQITSKSDLDSMSPAEINQARREGRLDGLLHSTT